MKPIRILVLSRREGLDEEALKAIEASAQEIRKEPGCIQFEHYRSVSDPDKLALIELWESAELYDAYWGPRVAARRATAQQAGNAVQGPGDRSVEFYHQQVFEMVDDVWTPLDPADRIKHVRWP